MKIFNGFPHDLVGSYGQAADMSSIGRHFLSLAWDFRGKTPWILVGHLPGPPCVQSIAIAIGLVDIQHSSQVLVTLIYNRQLYNRYKIDWYTNDIQSIALP